MPFEAKIGSLQSCEGAAKIKTKILKKSLLTPKYHVILRFLKIYHCQFPNIFIVLTLSVVVQSTHEGSEKY